MKEGNDLVARHHEKAVGLGPGGCQLGHKFRTRHPNRTGDALFVIHPRAQQLANHRRRSEATRRSGNVEKGFIERERFDRGSNAGEELHHASADINVGAVIGRNHDKIGTLPAST